MIIFNIIARSFSQFVVDPCMEFNVVKYSGSFILGTCKSQAHISQATMEVEFI